MPTRGAGAGALGLGGGKITDLPGCGFPLGPEGREGAGCGCPAFEDFAAGMALPLALGFAAGAAGRVGGAATFAFAGFAFAGFAFAGFAFAGFAFAGFACFAFGFAFAGDFAGFALGLEAAFFGFGLAAAGLCFAFAAGRCFFEEGFFAAPRFFPPPAAFFEPDFAFFAAMLPVASRCRIVV